MRLLHILVVISFTYSIPIHTFNPLSLKGNAVALEGTLKQFNIKVRYSNRSPTFYDFMIFFKYQTPNSASGSWLEQ